MGVRFHVDGSGHPPTKFHVDGVNGGVPRQTRLPGTGIPGVCQNLDHGHPPKLQRQFSRILCNTPCGRMRGSSEGGKRDEGRVQFDHGIA